MTSVNFIDGIGTVVRGVMGEYQYLRAIRRRGISTIE
jgi:hypothetical protein